MVSLFKIVGKKTSLLSCVVNLFLRDQKEKKTQNIYTKLHTSYEEKMSCHHKNKSFTDFPYWYYATFSDLRLSQTCRSMAVILGKTGSHACRVIGRPFSSFLSLTGTLTDRCTAAVLQDAVFQGAVISKHQKCQPHGCSKAKWSLEADWMKNGFFPQFVLRSYLRALWSNQAAMKALHPQMFESTSSPGNNILIKRSCYVGKR